MANAGDTNKAVNEAPERAGLVLAALILVAGVANLNLSVANVALPDIGKHFDSSQTTLDLIAVGYSLGLAASVLYLGALGDRYGRKLMLLLGMALSVPACLLAAFAPSDIVLFIARVIGGLSAGMAYPTTLALIAALWSGPGRTKSIALWSALGGAIASLGPLVSGALLEQFEWGSVFLVTLPLVVVAFPMAAKFVPAHVNETTEPVDNPGGILSVVLVAALILAINFAPVPNKGTLAIGLAAIAAAALIGFYIRQRRARNPLYDLHVAGRRIFWVAACAGIIVFGSLMGAAFVSQQFLQNVLGYSTLEAGAAFLPTIVFMVLVAPRSAKLVETRGARFTLLCGYVFLLLAFATMLLLWKEGVPYWKIGLAYVFIGIGVGFAGTPASHSLTGSVPVQRAGMASGTADLQRDLGGAIMQSIFGALLTAGYAAAAAAAIAAAPNNQRSPTASRTSSRSRSRARRPSRSSTRSTPARSRRRPSSPSSTATSGRTRPGSSRSCSARCSSSSCSRGRTRSSGSSPPTTPRTSHRPSGEHSPRSSSVAEDAPGLVGVLGRHGHGVGGAGSGDRGHPTRLHDARDAAFLKPLPDQLRHRFVVGHDIRRRHGRSTDRHAVTRAALALCLAGALVAAPPAAAASVDYGPISHKGLRSAGAASPGLQAHAAAGAQGRQLRHQSARSRRRPELVLVRPLPVAVVAGLEVRRDVVGAQRGRRRVQALRQQGHGRRHASAHDRHDLDQDRAEAVRDEVGALPHRPPRASSSRCRWTRRSCRRGMAGNVDVVAGLRLNVSQSSASSAQAGGTPTRTGTRRADLPRHGAIPPRWRRAPGCSPTRS